MVGLLWILVFAQGAVANVVDFPRSGRGFHPSGVEKISCAEILVLKKVDPFTKLELVGKRLELDSATSQTLYAAFKMHIDEPLWVEVLDRYYKNTIRLAAILKTDPPAVPGEHTPHSNSLRRLMRQELSLFAEGIQAGDPESIELLLNETIRNLQNVEILSSLVPTLEKTLPSDYVISVLSEELAASFSQFSVFSFPISSMQETENAALAGLFPYTIQEYNYRLSHVLEASSVRFAYEFPMEPLFKRISSAAQSIKGTFPVATDRFGSSLYVPRQTLNVISNVVGRTQLLAYLTERIFLGAYNYDEKGLGGSGPVVLLKPYLFWLNRATSQVSGLLLSGWYNEMTEDEVYLRLLPLSGLYDRVLPEAIRVYAAIRLLQGRSFVGASSKMVRAGSQQPVIVKPEDADRVVLPYLKFLTDNLH